MRAYHLAILLFIFFISSSFRIDTKLLSGVWVPTQNGVLEWTEVIPKNKRCYVFRANGSLIVRQNVGWCGTPPITYGNYNGTWKRTSDSTLSLHYEYWGGQVEAIWSIKSLNGEQMIYTVQSFDQIQKR